VAATVAMIGIVAGPLVYAVTTPLPEEKEETTAAENATGIIGEPIPENDTGNGIIGKPTNKTYPGIIGDPIEPEITIPEDLKLPRIYGNQVDQCTEDVAKVYVLLKTKGIFMV
jgi:hypothetical protein